MEGMIFEEEGVREPELTYWKPAPKPGLPATFSMRNPAYQCNPIFHPSLQSQTSPSCMYQPPSYLPRTGFHYPVTNIHPFFQHQQLSLGYEGERRRMPQCSQVSPESLLSALRSSAPTIDQDGQVTTDSLIHDEVTRAAKTLFSKRNRTLLHWLNPDVSKSQLKIDVNSAWDNLPQTEKVFYISQVLGKFAPHTTSLMVNPQLEPSKKENMSHTTTAGRNDIDDKTNTSTDSACPSDVVRVRRKYPESKVKKTYVKSKYERKLQKRRMVCSSEDEASCDSGLVMDLEGKKNVTGESQIKRKYNKRKQKEKIKEEMLDEECSSSSCPLPVKVSDIKKEFDADSVNPTAQRVKRKYIKRKLVRKKYKKREPKCKMTAVSPPESIESSTKEPELPVEDMDIWIELANDADLSKEIEEFRLLEDEVDSFWDNIDDPNNLFLELEIE